MRVISGVLLCALFAAACSERLGRSGSVRPGRLAPGGPFFARRRSDRRGVGIRIRRRNHVRNPLAPRGRGAGGGLGSRRTGRRHGAHRAEPYVPGSGRLPRLDGRGAALPPGRPSVARPDRGVGRASSAGVFALRCRRFRCGPCVARADRHAERIDGGDRPADGRQDPVCGQ